jgi:hypothetical protein
MSFNENVLKLIELANLFISGQLVAPEFEKKYIDKWRENRDFNNKKDIDECTQIYLDSVFTALDVYCSDPNLRDENDFDDEELLNEVIKLNKQWITELD